MTLQLPLGPVMCDVAGFELTDAERETLCHPLVGGVILFSRNFQNKEQLTELTAQIHALRSPALVITVDHEGGRVQRFREGFTKLPPMRALGELWEENCKEALTAARETGFVLAAELLACGVDLSFTPVLDLDFEHSAVIGNRAFHAQPEVVAQLALALVEGLNDAGMGSVGKHFPGHGFVEADSHTEIPVDSRRLEEIWLQDVAPYREALSKRLTGVMPAHVIYEKVDPNPAGFSKFWLQGILRQRIQFDGVIFSDDLTMEGATVVGDIVDRANAAAQAGCDMVLVCNRPDLTADLLARWTMPENPQLAERMARLTASKRDISQSRLEVARAVAGALVVEG